MYMPMRVITRKGKKYVYFSDVPNKRNVRKEYREMGAIQGRKMIFVTDPENKKNVFMYVSSKFYKSLYRDGAQTYWGKGDLVK